MQYIFNFATIKFIRMTVEELALGFEKLLDGKKKVTIISHFNPDGDAVGSSVGLNCCPPPHRHFWIFWIRSIPLYIIPRTRKGQRMPSMAAILSYAWTSTSREGQNGCLIF